MTDKDKIKFAIRYLKKGLKSKRTPPLYEELMKELGFEKKVHNLSCVAVDFFKENYPEYVTEKGECLSPYWDLFSAGVICATFELNIQLGKAEGKLADLTSEYYELENLKNNEITELKKENAELNDKLNNLAKVAEVRLANWQKYAKENEELKKKIENLQKYLDTQNCYRECAETWEKLTEAKDLIKNIIRVTWNSGWNYDLGWKVEAEKFLKESEE